MIQSFLLAGHGMKTSGENLNQPLQSLYSYRRACLTLTTQDRTTFRLFLKLRNPGRHQFIAFTWNIQWLINSYSSHHSISRHVVYGLRTIKG